jgi:hypothetical protein
MEFQTFTLRAQPHQRQDAHRIKATVDVNPRCVVSLHQAAGESFGCDILLETGLILPVEEDRTMVRSRLEGNSS